MTLPCLWYLFPETARLQQWYRTASFDPEHPGKVANALLLLVLFLRPGAGNLLVPRETGLGIVPFLESGDELNPIK